MTLARFVAATLLLVSGAASAVSAVGTVAPWLPARAELPIDFTELPVDRALLELYAGRADVALVTLPGPPTPPGVGPATWVPVGTYAVHVAYRLPGVDLQLDVETACRIMSGEVRVWSDERIAQLNPDARLPNLPIVTTAHTAPNGPSLAFAAACVEGGWWRPALHKSNWRAGAAMARSSRAQQISDLSLTGSFGVLGPDDAPRGQQLARLRSADGSFVPPSRAALLAGSPEEGGAVWPEGPMGLPPRVTQPGAYPLRGLVWAVVMTDQRYRGRTLADARAVLEVVRALQRSSGGQVVSPGGARPAVNLRYGGAPLEWVSERGPR